MYEISSDNCIILKITTKVQENPGIQVRSVERLCNEGPGRSQSGQKGSQAPTPTTPCTQKHTRLLLQNHSVCLLCFLIQVEFFISSVWQKPVFINLATHLNHQESSVNPSAEASSRLNQNFTGGDAGINTFKTSQVILLCSQVTTTIGSRSHFFPNGSCCLC